MRKGEAVRGKGRESIYIFLTFVSPHPPNAGIVLKADLSGEFHRGRGLNSTVDLSI